MKAIIYTRFSPRRNAEESQSCETQESLCREYAEEKGWPVGAVYADRDMSGSDANRPGLADAIAELAQGDVLLVYKRDRLARDMLIAELTRRQVAAVGARIVAVSGDIEGDDDNPSIVFVRQIMDGVAELERKQIAKRTKDSMRQLQKKGRRMGRWAPYGYRICPEDSTRIEQDEWEQKALARIGELRDMKLEVAAMVRILNNEMPEVARGSRWRSNAIKRILSRMDNTQVV